MISVTLAPGWRCEKTGSLAEALTVFLPAILSKEPGGRELQEERNRCPLLKFCDICPSAAYLETGSLDGHVDYLCRWLMPDRPTG